MLATATENVGQNTLLEYVMGVDMLAPLLEVRAGRGLQQYPSAQPAFPPLSSRSCAAAARPGRRTATPSSFYWPCSATTGNTRWGTGEGGRGVASTPAHCPVSHQIPNLYLRGLSELSEDVLLHVSGVLLPSSLRSTPLPLLSPELWLHHGGLAESAKHVSRWGTLHPY